MEESTAGSYGEQQGNFLTFTHVGMSKRTHDDARVVRLVNNFLTVCLPSLSYTAISIVWGNGCVPMDVHKHPRDDSALSGVVAVGDFRGGGFFTTAWMGGGGEGGAQRQAWMQYKGLLWMHERG